MPIQSAGWARELYKPYDFKVPYGGRSGGKSTECARAIVRKAKNEPLRICVARAFKNSIEESNKALLEEQIRVLGFEAYFTVTDDAIDCNITGAHIFFQGMTRNTGSLRGLEGVDILWIDEGQYIGLQAWETMLPTMRKPGNEIWVTFNPTNATDPVWIEFCANEPPENSFIHKVNYLDNKFRDASVDRRAERDRRLYPHRYPHIWLGELDEGGDDQKRVVPFHFIDASIGEPEYDYKREPVRAGFDVADEGEDESSFVIRQGPVILYMETMPYDIGGSCDRARELCELWQVHDLWYDPTGIGTGVRDRFKVKMPCKNVVGVQFGGAVAGKRVSFEDRQKNEDVFMLRNAQLGWNLRIRAENSRRNTLDPDLHLDPRRCLYILPGVMQAGYRSQIAQPLWRINDRGKIRVDKKPRGAAKSPDIYDGSILAFAHDIRNGLKSGGRHLVADGSKPPMPEAVLV